MIGRTSLAIHNFSAIFKANCCQFVTPLVVTNSVSILFNIDFIMRIRLELFFQKLSKRNKSIVAQMFNSISIISINRFLWHRHEWQCPSPSQLFQIGFIEAKTQTTMELRLTRIRIIVKDFFESEGIKFKMEQVG